TRGTLVSTEQRFSRTNPCPVCSGHDAMARRRGQRCYGFVSSDGSFAHCTREDYAGGAPLDPDSQTYAHRLNGPCPCGREHGGMPSPRSSSVRRHLAESDFARCVPPYPCDYRDENGRVLYRVARWV